LLDCCQWIAELLDDGFPMMGSLLSGEKKKILFLIDFFADYRIFVTFA